MASVWAGLGLFLNTFYHIYIFQSLANNTSIRLSPLLLPCIAFVSASYLLTTIHDDDDDDDDDSDGQDHNGCPAAGSMTKIGSIQILVPARFVKRRVMASDCASTWTRGPHFAKVGS